MELPYTPRPGQQQLIQFFQTLEGTGATEATTGAGKSIAALVGTIPKGPTIVATRTNSQQQQFLREAKQLRKHGQDPGLVVPLMGRNHFCPHLAGKPELAGGTAEELGRLCRIAKKKSVRAKEAGTPVKGSCPYYDKLLADGPEPVEAILRAGVSGPTEFADRVISCGSCPYEATKELLPYASAVLCPSVFVIDHGLRPALLNWLGRASQEVHVVLDEAHHIPQSVRDHFSATLGVAALQRAHGEAKGRNVLLAGTMPIPKLLNTLRALIQDAQEHILEGDDVQLPPGYAMLWLMETLQCPSPALFSMAQDLQILGEIIREEQEKKGKLPRSYLGSVGATLQLMLQAPASMAGFANATPEPSLSWQLLDAAEELDWQAEFASVAHMSGTLSPIDAHAKLCGMTPEIHEAKHRLPGLRIYGLEGVHRRWKEHQENPALAEKQQELAAEFIAIIPGRKGLFFPSYQMMHDYLEEGFLYGKELFLEEPGMSTPQATGLVEQFSNGPDDALLLGVLGGKLSEGMDFPGKAMESLLIFGIPYPKPTAKQKALLQYLDRKHPGEGWNLAVQTPVGRVMRQAIGRLVRGPEESGTALILDERAVRFRPQLEGLRMIQNLSEIGDLTEETGFSRAKIAPQNHES